MTSANPQGAGDSASSAAPARMVRESLPKPLGPVAGWILFCVFCNCAGWLLSAVHQLNATGYSVALSVLLLLAITFRKRFFSDRPIGGRLKKLCRRFRRMFPLAYLALAIMAILGGILWPPGNPDGLTQRIPRVLHWLAEQRWHWIDHSPHSFNTHACGFEWLMSPMLAILRTDRWVFVYNGICYLLMPGLVFSLFRRLGVSGRVAWHWMWLLPAGLGFAMQAGSIGNDAVGALFALAAVDFAARAWTSRRAADVWLSILAAALLSGLKTSNLPLGLPWLIAIWPSLRLLWQRPFRTALVLTVALLSSLLPVMLAIRLHGGDWLGRALESEGMSTPAPWVTLTANTLNLALGNLQPPVFPLADRWNEHAYRLLPKGLLTRMEAGFEPGAAHLRAIDLQFEVCAGLGVGVSLLLLISWLCARRRPPRPASSPPPVGTYPRYVVPLVRWSAVISLLVFMRYMNVSSLSRLVMPYYCLVIPLLLTGAGHQRLVRARWWKVLAAAVFLLAAVMLILNPPRPLWPAQTLLSRLSAGHPHSYAITRGMLLYQSYAVRWDLLAPVRDHIPADATNVGLMTYISASPMQTSLWRPFGHRRIWPLKPTHSREDLAMKGIEYVVIALEGTPPRDRAWLEAWSQDHGGSVIAEVPVRNRATGDPWPWYVIKLAPATN